jgi:hypothetical protein
MNISRRTVLQGLGASLALPTLDANLGLNALKQSAAAPQRMAFLFVPNGINMDYWRPGAPGALPELPGTLKALDGVRGQLNVISGLAQDNAHAHGDGPGDHARSSAAWLTGVHPRKTKGADIKVGVSVDQVAAQRIGDRTKFRSLELGCERGAMSGDCDSGYSCAYSSTISWRSETTPNAKEVSPRALFERLFGDADSAMAEQSRDLRRRRKASILDFVLEEAKTLQATLGQSDQRKVGEYLESVRDIESRLERAESDLAARVLSGATIPAPGIPADRGEHIRLIGDMMVLAFQADLTRFATFMFANEGSNRPYREIGVTDGHHDISHHGREPGKLEDKRKIDEFHVAQLSYILNKMNSIKESDGTLLDNSMIVFGGGISDGNRHNHNDLPIVIAGKAGGRLPGGRHLVYPDMTPLNNLYISMLDWVGVDVEDLGDATGELKGLF